MTQSEVLSGGIPGDQIGFFNTATIEEITNCCELAQDQALAFKAEQISTSSKPENLFT